MASRIGSLVVILADFVGTRSREDMILLISWSSCQLPVGGFQSLLNWWSRRPPFFILLLFCSSAKCRHRSISLVHCRTEACVSERSCLIESRSIGMKFNPRASVSISTSERATLLMLRRILPSSSRLSAFLDLNTYGLYVLLMSLTYFGSNMVLRAGA